MKKTLLMTCTFLALSVGLASAGPGGLTLAWQECEAGAGAHNRAFACNTNSGGGHILFGSFVASSHMVSVTGYAGVVDVQTGGPSLAPWWDIRVGGCRAAGSLVWSSDFTGGPFSCLDYFQGGASGGNTVSAPAGNRVRWKPVGALPLGDSRITSIPEGTEVYCFKLTLNNLQTVGSGSCAGCLQPACIVLNSILVTQTPGNPAGNKYLTNPIANAASWQGGLGDCFGATPTKNATWGQVKSLYR